MSTKRNQKKAAVSIQTVTKTKMQFNKESKRIENYPPYLYYFFTNYEKKE